jgi:acyl-CoA dehydrogenase
LEDIVINDLETLNVLLNTVRQFVQNRLVPNETTIEENNSIPDTLVSEMKDLGLFGMSIPQEFGGLGLTLEEEVLVAFELGQTSPAFRSVFGTNNGIGSQGLIMDGTIDQKKRYLPMLASGELIASFALTEPNAGSDAASLQTTAKRDGNFYVLNGTKRYITNAPQAHVFTLLARTNPQEQGSKGISAFFVEKNSPGITLGKIDKKMGQRGSHTCDVVFENCRVPAENLIGKIEGQGFKTAMKVLDRGRLHIAAVCVGVAERMLRDTVKYAIERHQFGKPIAEFEMIQAMLADCKTELYAARCMVLESARLGDSGKPYSTEASCCKLFASEMCGRVADKAVQIHGGAGYVSEYSIERFYRDVRLFRLYEGTSQIQQLVIARNMCREAVQ